MSEGSFRITLDVPARVQRPATEISGKVILSGERSQDVAQVQIDFRGIAEVKFLSSLTGQRSRAVTTLFHLQRIVSRTRSKFDNATLSEWPFSFSFPLAAQTSDKWQANPLFASVSGSPLPPSFTYSNSAFDCKVEYSLEAKVVNNHCDSVVDRYSHKCYLLFEPLNSSRGSDHPLASFTRNFTSFIRPPDTKSDGQTPSFKKRLSTYISRDRIASTSFTVDVKVPSVIVQRERFPCHISICVDDSNTSPMPRVEIQGVTVVILSHTYVRGGSHKEATKYTNNIQVVAHQNLDIPIRVNENVDLSTILSDLHAPVLPPTFTSYNITRRYEMKITLLVACADDKFQFIGDVPSLKVVSAAAEAPVFSAEDIPPSYDMTISPKRGSPTSPPYTAEKSHAKSSGAVNAEAEGEFKMKARIFEFVPPKAGWKERCHGSLYLKSEASGRTRLLVLQNGTHKVFAKHYGPYACSLCHLQLDADGSSHHGNATCTRRRLEQELDMAYDC